MTKKKLLSTAEIIMLFHIDKKVWSIVIIAKDVWLVFEWTLRFLK